MRTVPLLIATTALSAACVPLASGLCTMVGCNGMYELTFDRSDAWEDGEYELSVAFDDAEPTVCTFTLPLAEETSCAFTPISLDGNVLVVPIPTGMDESLVEAEILLDREGSEVLSEVVEPNWDAPFWPNGEQCDKGNGCLSAEETFSL